MLHLPAPVGAAFAGAAAIGAALVLHRFVELPSLKRLRHRTSPGLRPSIVTATR
jgi:peptidoglycan/LPS O-acetylase OafA/YrhL